MPTGNTYRSSKPRGFGRSSRPSGGGGGFRRSGSGGGSRYGRGNRGANNKKYINPEKFIHKAIEVPAQKSYVATNSFADFGFENVLVKRLKAIGYENPTQIQDESIPITMSGQDVVGLANTGTGKTAAFLLPIINNLLKTNARESVLVIAPTRELAQQINDEFKRFTEGMQLFSALCVGGLPIYRQKQTLSRRPHVIVGTPGRLNDLLRQRALFLELVDVVILDEADRMLDMGFIPDVKLLLSEAHKDRQTLCFSATVTPEISRLFTEFMKEHKTVSTVQGKTSDHIEQNIVRYDNNENKLRKLLEILEKPEFDRVLVFAETKRAVQKLADQLNEHHGHKSTAIHGDKTQRQRQRSLKQFMEDDVQVMVATDVAARGLDIPNVDLVINFEQPGDYDTYVHRIGRTGRAGNTGHALTFVK